MKITRTRGKWNSVPLYRTKRKNKKYILGKTRQLLEIRNSNRNIIKKNKLLFSSHSKTIWTIFEICQVGWSCRIHRLHLCRGVRTQNQCPGYDTKQSYGEVPIILELLGMQSTPSLPSFPGLFRTDETAPDRVLSMGHIELNRGFKSVLFLYLNCVFMLN